MWIRKAVRSLPLIMFVALAGRLLFAIDQAPKIPPPMLQRAVFQTEAGSIGRSLAQGKGFSSPYERETGPTAILPPVYPLIVAGVFKVSGIESVRSFCALVLLNILFATLTCVPIYLTGQRISGPGVAAGAAWLWALFPNGILIPFEWIWETSLSALLAATLLWTTLRLAESRRSRDWAAYGLLWGFALMTNPAIGAALPLLLGWAAWRARKYLTLAWSKPALAAAIALLCCAPWTIRNYTLFHRFIPLRSGFGFELYIGNNENYDPRQTVWPPQVTYERELLRYIHMGEMPFMDEERRKAVEFIQSHPAIALKLFGERIIDFWTGSPAPLQVFLRDRALFDRFILACNLLAPLLALAGLSFMLLKGREYLVPLTAIPLTYPFVYYITHTSLRYRHVIDPVVFLLVALAVTAAGHSLSRQRAET